MDNSDMRDSMVATIAAAVFFLAILAVGIIIVANELNITVNIALVGGCVLGALGFVGIAAVIWSLIRRLLN